MAALFPWCCTVCQLASTEARAQRGDQDQAQAQATQKRKKRKKKRHAKKKNQKKQAIFESGGNLKRQKKSKSRIGEGVRH